MHKLVFVIFLALMLLLGLFMNSCECFTEDCSVDLVISRYNEDLSWMEKLPLKKFRNIICYNKGSKDFKTNVKVVNLPNVGKCDHTYLYHIIHNYDNLADVTIFLPGSVTMSHKWAQTNVILNNVFKTCNSVFPSLRYNDVKKDMYNFYLNEWKTSHEQNLKLNNRTELLYSPIRPFGKWFEHVFPNMHITAAAYYGIFAVSKKHILQHPKEYYEKLITYLDSHENPEVGHYFERSWIAIFDKIPEECIYPQT